MVQQANTGDRAANIEKLQTNIRTCVSQGAELVVLQELHNGLYFCQTEETDVFDQAESVPGPSTEAFGALAKELGVVLVLSLFEKRAPGLYHNTAVVIEKDGSIAGKYRKMLYRMIRLITRSSILHPAIWDSNRSKLRSAN